MSETGQNLTPKKRRIPKWEKAFITALALQGVVAYACQESKVSRSMAYQHRANHEDFAAAWDEALEMAADALELEARRRAHDGVDEPVYGRVGKDEDGEIGTIRKYSDTLLMFLLKAARPQKFRERHEISTPDGQPLFKIYDATADFNPNDA